MRLSVTATLSGLFARFPQLISGDTDDRLSDRRDDWLVAVSNSHSANS